MSFTIYIFKFKIYRWILFNSFFSKELQVKGIMALQMLVNEADIDKFDEIKEMSEEMD